MTSQLIGTTETGWFNPAVNPPPFDMKLLLMVAGSRSEDCGRTFEPYTVVMTAYVQQQGPGDEYDDETAFDEYMSGDQTDFLDFQFDLKDEDGEVLDWYSDSIVAWAYYPLGIAQTAVNVERERQVALAPPKSAAPVRRPLDCRVRYLEANMERVFSDKIVTAKKHYRCDASEQWRRAGYTVADCETGEQRLMVEAAEADKWRILPGQAYRKVTGIHEGDFCTYRARPGMDAVCSDLDMWDE